MLARMSKVEILGERGLLQDSLSLLREMGIFQIEPAALSVLEKGKEERPRSRRGDERTVFERLYFEDLRRKIDELLSRLPEMPVRESYIQPQSIIGTMGYTIEKHLETCRKLQEKKESAAAIIGARPFYRIPEYPRASVERRMPPLGL